MINFEPHLEEKAVADILNRLIDMLDKQPMAYRSRPPGFRINTKELPSFFSLEDAQDRKLVWRFIEQLATLQWIKITGCIKSVDTESWSGEPRIVLVPEAESAIRKALGRTEVEASYLRSWQEALRAARNSFSGDIELLSRSPLRIPNRSAQEVIEQLVKVSEFRSGAFAREISARVFWGLSKILDGRVESVNTAFGRQILIEKPLLVNVHVPSDTIEEVIFIENEVSYLSAIDNCPPGAALVWASGFKLSARRLLEPNGMVLHVSSESVSLAGTLASHLLHGSVPSRLFFFGDLDYSGMQILKQLREVFPTIVSWQPGYKYLLEQLHIGNAHPADDADKTGQKDPVSTGCVFADSVLLPQIREGIRNGLGYVDQEAFLW
ncbi:MAG: Wadjet anti-phage system protein JetD domain-containing protein [Candidatus Thiodiazotropha endolucinida]